MEKFRILIVEDESIVAMDIFDQLTAIGYDPIAITQNGDDAVVQARQLRPDLVLMDIRLAGETNGITAAIKIREQCHLPVIILTAFDGDNVRERAKQAEPYGYIIKPFEKLELRSIIEMALFKHKAESAFKESEFRSGIISRMLSDFAYICKTGDCNSICSMKSEWLTAGFYTITGYSVEDVHQHNCWLFSVHPDDQNQAKEQMQQVQTTAKSTCDFRILSKNGEVRWVRNVVQSAEDPSNHGQIRIFGAAQDITLMKKLESQYLRAQRLESVGILASGIVHDLNNVFSPIIMGLGALQDTLQANFSPEDKEILTMIQESARRGSEIVRQLLTFARGTELTKNPIQPKHILKEIGNLLCQLFPKSIQAYTDFCKNPRQIKAAPTQLHQVLINLCVNARDAMPQGGVINVILENVDLDATMARCHPKAHPGPYVLFKVSDNGTGIPPEILDRIFDPFFTTKAVGEGTGLGLATVLGIVESHDGFILVDSQLGKGTTFSVYFPAVAAPENPDFIPTTGDSIDGQGELILVVDDESIICRILKMFLVRHGYQALTAGNVPEALEIFTNHQDQIRLILTDMIMPVIDGCELIMRIRALDTGIPILVMSGLTATGTAREILAQHTQGFLSKPIESENLIKLLAEQLHTR